MTSGITNYIPARDRHFGVRQKIIVQIVINSGDYYYLVKSQFFFLLFFQLLFQIILYFLKASQFWNPVAGLIRWVGRLDAAHGPSVDSHWFTSSLQLAGMDTRYNVLLSLLCGTALMSPDTEGHLFHFKLLSAFTLIRGDVPHAAHMHIATGLFIGRI